MTSQVHITEFVTDFSKSEANTRSYAATVKALLAGIRADASNPINVTVTGTNRLSAGSQAQRASAIKQVNEQADIRKAALIPTDSNGKRLFGGRRAAFEADTEAARAAAINEVNLKFERAGQEAVAAREASSAADRLKAAQTKRQVDKDLQHSLNERFFRDRERANEEGLSAATRSEIAARASRVKILKSGTASTASLKTEIAGIVAARDAALSGGLGGKAAAKGPPGVGGGVGTSLTRGELASRSLAAQEQEIAVLRASADEIATDTSLRSGVNKKLLSTATRKAVLTDEQVIADEVEIAGLKVNMRHTIAAAEKRQEVAIALARDADAINNDARENVILAVVRNKLKAAEARLAVETDSAGKELLGYSLSVAELKRDTLIRSAAEKDAIRLLADGSAARIKAIISTEKLAAAEAAEVSASREAIAAKTKRIVEEAVRDNLQKSSDAERLSADARYIASKTERTVNEQIATEVEATDLANEQAANKLLILTKEESATAIAVRTATEAESAAQNETLIAARASATVAAQLEADTQAAANAQNLRETDLGKSAIEAKARYIVQQELYNSALREAVILEGEANQLRGVQLASLAHRVAPHAGGTGGVAGSITQGEGAAGARRFLQAGTVSVLRRAVPAALLFGAAAATVKMVKTAEELVQINVRLEAQFENLGNIGTFDAIAAGFGEVNAETRKLAADSALEDYRRGLMDVARETATLSADTFNLGIQFSGLFASLGAGGDLTDLSKEATNISLEFAKISGQDPDEAFNDLVGAIKSFTGDAPTAVSTLDDLTNSMISVADATGVSAANLADFVGRIAPIAKTAGFTLKDLNAIGATLLQASGVGGAGLAEQFARIITGFSGKIGRELSRLSIDFPKLDLNIDAIAAGRSNEVLTDLINNFDKLTSAEQSQIIASIGSRREGNTLATLLQNVTTFQQGLAAQTDVTGVRQERMALILTKLTGSYEKLKVSLELLGQGILNAGLAQILIGLLDAIKSLVKGLELLGKVLGPVVHFLADALPDGTGKSIVQITALTLALRAMTRSMIAAKTSSVLLNGTTGLSAGRKVAAGLSLGMKGLGLAAAAVAVGYVAVRAAQNLMNRSSEAARKRTEALTKSLRESKSEFILAADAVDTYVKSVGLVDSGKAGGTAAGQVGGVETPASIVSNQIARLVNDPTTDANIETLAAVSGKFSGGVNEFVDSFLRSGDDLGGALERLRKIAEHPSLQNLDQSRGGDRPNGFTTGSIRKDVNSEALDAVLSLIDSNEITFEQASAFMDQVIIASDSSTGLIETEVAKAKLAADLGIKNNDFTKKAFDDLVADLKGKGVAAPEVLAINVLTAGQDTTQEVVAEARATLEQKTEELKAGLLSVDEYSVFVTEELDKLRAELASDKRAGTASSLANAVEVQKAINDITKSFAGEVKKKFDDLVALRELLGTPLVGDELIGGLQALAADPAIQSDSEAFFEVVKLLVDAERQQVLDAANRIDNLTERQAFLDSHNELSAGTASLVTKLNVVNNRVPITAALDAAGTSITSSESGLSAAFDSTAAMLDDGLSLNRAVRALVQEEIDKLKAKQSQISGRAAAGLQGQIDFMTQFLQNADLGLPDIPSGADANVDVRSEQQKADDAIAAAEGNREAIASNFSFQEDVLAALGVGQDVGSKISRAADLLSNPALRGSSEAQDAAHDIIDLNNSINDLVGEEKAKALEVIDILTAAGSNPIEAANIELIFGALNNQGSVFNDFLNAYLDVGVDVTNTLTRTIAELVNGGALVVEATEEVLRKELARLLSSLQLGDPSGVGREIQGVLAALQGISSSGLSKIRFTGGGASSGKVGGGGGSAASSASDMISAQIAWLKALVGDDPVKLAKIDQDAAAAAILAATNAAEKLRSWTDKINADRAYENAVHDVFVAQNELAIVLANQAGNTVEALRLGVSQAKSNLDLLTSQGAGEAAIAGAQIAVINAQQAETVGLRDAKLGDLDFLHQIGDLSTQAYITALGSILEQLDPVADKDIWRKLTLQIQSLRASASELSTNLPSSFDLPTLFEVRRVNQANAFSGSGAPGLIPFSNNDNKIVNITVNVSTGLDWENAKSVIGDALGVDARSLTLSTNRY